jgi:hypothetical protein
VDADLPGAWWQGSRPLELDGAVSDIRGGKHVASLRIGIDSASQATASLPKRHTYDLLRSVADVNVRIVSKEEGNPRPPRGDDEVSVPDSRSTL